MIANLNSYITKLRSSPPNTNDANPQFISPISHCEQKIPDPPLFSGNRSNLLSTKTLRLLFHLWRLERYRLPRPVLSSNLWSVTGISTIGKSWWSEGVRSYKWVNVTWNIRIISNIELQSSKWSLFQPYFFPSHFSPLH